MPDTVGVLRAERWGGGAGRLYSFLYRVSDLAGNSGQCPTAVSVSHDRGKSSK